MKITGKTTDGRDVVGGVFKMVDTHGLPLADAVMLINDRGFVVDWFDFIVSANSAGWNDKTIKARINEGVLDSLGPNHAGEVMKRVDRIL